MKNKLIMLTAVVLATTTLTACSGATNDGQGGTKVTKTSKKAAKPKIKYYKIGDTVKVGKAEYTLKSAVTTLERNQFESNTKHVIKITYHVKNNDKDDLTIGTDLDVYGPDNTKLKTYPIEDQTLDSIAPGKEGDVVTGFRTNRLGSFELQFRPFSDHESAAAKFKVKIR